MSDFDLRKLLQMVAPVVGGLAMDPAHQTGFQSGYLNGQHLAQQEKERKQALDQKKREAGARYMLEAQQHLNTIDDPVEFARTVDQYDSIGAKAGYTKPTEVKSSFAFPESRVARKRTKEIADELAVYEKNYDLDDLAKSGSYLQLKDGSKIPFSTAIEMTRKRPIGADNKPIPAPKKVDTSASTDYGRALARYATKDLGKSVTDLTFAEEEVFKKRYDALNDKAPAAPKLAPASADAQLEDLMSLWKEGHPGQEMPTSVRTQLRVQAKKDIGQADDKAPNASGRGANGLMPGQEFAISEKLAKTWQDTTKAQREMNRQFSLMTTGLKRFREGDKNGGSQGVLVTFQKILDPSSVVRESEYARSAAGISMLGRIEGYMDRLKAGGAGVPDAELAGMVETARQFLADMNGFNNGQRKRIESQAKKYQIDPALIFDDVASGGSDPAASARRKLSGR